MIVSRECFGSMYNILPRNLMGFFISCDPDNRGVGVAQLQEMRLWRMFLWSF